MGLRDAMRKAAGLLVELPPEEQSAESGDAVQDDIDRILAGNPATPEDAVESKTVEQIVSESDGPNLKDIQVEDVPATAPGAPTDFAAVYSAAKLPPSPFTAEQMLEMLASLPSELPLDTKRQTVKVTLASLGKTMGATPETIVADASRKLAALHAYIEHLTKRTESFTASGEDEIAELQSQIEEKRKAILDAKNQLSQMSRSCDSESDRLDDVLEFFSLDIAPSKYAEQGTPPAGTQPTQ